MIHQRSILWILRIITFIFVMLFLPYIPYIGKRYNVWVIIIVSTIIIIPIEILIRKIFPAPDWYAHEDEGSKMTSLNLTATKNGKDGNKNKI